MTADSRHGRETSTSRRCRDCGRIGVGTYYSTEKVGRICPNCNIMWIELRGIVHPKAHDAVKEERP